MALQSIILTKRELEIMEIIWLEDRTLTNKEFMALKPDTPKAITQRLLNTLVNKNLLNLIGFSGIEFGGDITLTYSYVISSEVYYLQQLVLSPSMNSKKIPRIVRGLYKEIEHLENEKIDRIQDAIRKELKKDE